MVFPGAFFIFCNSNKMSQPPIWNINSSILCIDLPSYIQNTRSGIHFKCTLSPQTLFIRFSFTPVESSPVKCATARCNFPAPVPSKGSGYSSSRGSRQGTGREKYGPPVRTEYRLIVENLSSRCSWQDLKVRPREHWSVYRPRRYSYDYTCANLHCCTLTAFCIILVQHMYLINPR